MKIKKGDKVVVVTGSSKGTIGIVKQTFPSTNKLIVENVGLKTKHIKPSQQNPDGGIEKKEYPIHASNVRFVVSEKKGEVITSRLRYSTDKGKKSKKRIAIKTGEKI